MRAKITTSITVLALHLSGCIPPDAIGTLSPQNTSQVGKTLTVQMGEKVYESGQLDHTMTATTQATASGHMYGLHYINTPSGFTGELLTDSHDGSLAMCVDVGEVSGGIFVENESYKCLVDANKDKAFESSRYSNHRPYWPLKEKVPYTTAIQKATPKSTSGGYKCELVYQGYAQGVLRFAYREYVNDMARPAFSQDLTYERNASEPTVIGFKGLRMRVLDANNTSITYVIDKGLDNR